MTEHEFEHCQSWLNRQPLFAIQGPRERKMLRGLSEFEKRKIERQRESVNAQLGHGPGALNVVGNFPDSDGRRADED